MLSALDKQGYIALDIHFDTAKAVIKPESQPIVDQTVALLKGNPKLKIGVEGHTDNVGTPASNQGVDHGRLSSAGFGEDRPVADNRTRRRRGA